MEIIVPKLLKMLTVVPEEFDDHPVYRLKDVMSCKRKLRMIENNSQRKCAQILQGKCIWLSYRTAATPLINSIAESFHSV